MKIKPKKKIKISYKPKDLKKNTNLSDKAIKLVVILDKLLKSKGW